jgi:hypothetical protein
MSYNAFGTLVSHFTRHPVAIVASRNTSKDSDGPCHALLSLDAPHPQLAVIHGGLLLAQARGAPQGKPGVRAHGWSARVIEVIG